MNRFIVLVVLLFEMGLSFHSLNQRRGSLAMLKMALTKPVVDVFAKDFELTPALKERVDTRIGTTVDKLGKDIITANVVLKVVKNPPTEAHSQPTKKDSQIAEVTLSFKGGRVVHASEGTDSMYASIDLVAHRLARSIRKHNEKLSERDRREIRKVKEEDLASVLEIPVEEENAFNPDDLLTDLPEQYRINIKKTTKPLHLVKPKKFPMPPISVDEAVNALEFIDHPFYVFRNKDTNEINVVYRRNHGGVGIIRPSDGPASK